MKAAIIDFNRTLWDPEKQQWMEGAIDLLQTLKEQGVKLALISSTEDKEKRAQQIAPLSSFFDIVKIVDQKSSEEFHAVITNLNVKNNEAVIIGDKIDNEIKIGNTLGMTTIRLQAGKHAIMQPQTKEEQPDYSFTTLPEITNYLKEKLGGSS